MDSFKQKYPAFTALLTLVGDFGKEMGDHNESVLKNLADSVKLFPQLLTFVPLASQVDDEAKLIAQNPEEIVAGVEILVTEFAFSNEKAKAVIAASFEVAEGLAGMVPKIKNLVTAIKA